MKAQNKATRRIRISKTIFSIVVIFVSFIGAPTYVSAMAATPIPTQIVGCLWSLCYAPAPSVTSWGGTTVDSCMSAIDAVWYSLPSPNASCQAVCTHFGLGNFNEGINQKPYGDPVWALASDVYCGGGYSCPAGWTLSGSSCFAPDLTTSGPTPTTVTLGGSTVLTSSVTSAAGGANTATTFSNVFQFANDTVGTGAQQPPLAGTSISGINVGQSKSTTYSWTPASAGTYYVRACPDNTTGWVSAVVESNEGNNCSSNPWTTITVVAPDFYPDGGVSTASAPIAGSPVALTANFKNNGTANTSATFPNVFQFANDTAGTGAQTPLAGSTIVGLNVNQIKSTTYSWTPPSAGNYYVRACADNTTGWVSSVVESNELNNCSGSPWTTISVSSAASCTLPWGAVMLSGAPAVNAYQTASATSPAVCGAPQQYTCNNGTLSGTTYQNQSCTQFAACTDANATWDTCLSSAACVKPPDQLTGQPGVKYGICPNSTATTSACSTAMVNCTDPIVSCDNDGRCDAGETINNCYNDCKIKPKFWQF